MKFNFLHIEKPCSEDFSKMKPSESGRFCELCEKNVVDFTQLSALEIAKIMQNSNGKVCGRMTERQLQLPIIEYNVQRNGKSSLSNIAAGLLVASALGGHPLLAENALLKTDLNIYSHKNIEQNSKEISDSEFVTFRGRVVVKESGIPVENAQVSIVTLSEIFTTNTTVLGTFSLKIPKSALRDQNVASFSFTNISNQEIKEELVSENIILGRAQVSSYEFKANAKTAKKWDDTRIYLGRPSHSKTNRNTLIVINGKIETAEVLGKLAPEKVKDVQVYEDEFAIAIGGTRGKDGIIIVTTYH